MSNLKNNFINGVLWGIIDKFAILIIGSLITIILSRKLLPSDYGIVGLLMIFNIVGLVLLDSGFGHALIRKENPTQTDYSTVFFFNILLSIILYFTFFIFSPYIALFYNEPRLTLIARISFLLIPINSLVIVQNSILLRRLDQKKITIASIISSLFSGIIGITSAIIGLGVWALIFQNLSLYFIKAISFWYLSDWKPSFSFKLETIKELWKYSINLLGVNLLAGIFQNIYQFLIGKFYSLNEVGFFNQAVRMEGLPRSSLNNAIQSIAYPVLSKFQNNNEGLKYIYKRIITISVFINFPLMVGLIIPAEKLFILILSEKWIPSVAYFRLLCMIGAFSPFILTTVIIFKAKGQSKKYFKIEIASKFILIISIYLTITRDIALLLIAGLITTILTSCLNMYYAGKEINYSLKEQLRDILPIIFATALMISAMYYIDIISIPIVPSIILQFTVGIIVFIITSRIIKIPAYFEIVNLIKEKLRK